MGLPHASRGALLAIGLALGLALGAGPSCAEELDTILSRIASINRFSESYSATLRIESHSPESPTGTSTYRMYSKGLRKTLLVFVEPRKDAGKKIAMNGRSLWFYFPRARQSIIVRPVSTLTGSVAVGDMIGEPLLELYAFSESLPTEDGQGSLLAFAARGADSPYGRIVYEYRGGRIASQACYARSGMLLKTIRFEEYAEAGKGQDYATRMRVQNAVYPEYYSIIRISDLRKREDIPDFYFTPEGLADAGAGLR
jgi:outer membrane lipoprotein-sorting protein